MIAREDNDGVAREVRVLKEPKKLADLVVDVGTIAEVGAPCSEERFAGDRLIPAVDAFENALGVRVLVFLVDKDLWLGDLDTLVLLPEGLSRCIRIVRVR